MEEYYDSENDLDSEERQLERSEWLTKLIPERQRRSRTKSLKKLLEDREKIRALNSSPDDGVNPAMVFPKEIWAMILVELKDPNDVQSAWRTCNLFRELLDRRRFEEVVLPAVFQIPLLLDLLGEPEEEEKENDDEVSDREEESEDDADIANGNSSSSKEESQKYPRILKIRSVCKSWKRGFDLSIHRRLTNSSAPLKSLILRHDGNKKLDEFEEGTSFFRGAVKIMIPIHYNHRARSIYPEVVGLWEPVRLKNWSHHPQFFKNAGPQILAFEMVCEYREDYPFEWNEDGVHVELWDIYLALLNLLESMPNLVSLGVGLQCVEGRVGPNYGENVHRVAKLHPVPQLRSVNRLHLRVDPDHLCLHFLSACPNVTVLELECGNTVSSYGGTSTNLGKVAEAVRTLPHVRSFKVVAHADDDFDKIASLFSEDWKLRSVHIQVLASSYRNRYLDTEVLFRLVERYAATLETLELIVWSLGEEVFGEPDFMRRNVKLNLPKLTRFKFEMENSVEWGSLDFLLPLENLEHLELIYRTNDEECEEYSNVVINFINNESYKWNVEDRSGSNLWDVFPALKTFVTRAGKESLDYVHWKVTEFRRGQGKRVFHYKEKDN